MPRRETSEERRQRKERERERKKSKESDRPKESREEKSGKEEKSSKEGKSSKESKKSSKESSKEGGKESSSRSKESKKSSESKSENEHAKRAGEAMKAENEKAKQERERKKEKKEKSEKHAEEKEKSSKRRERSKERDDGKKPKREKVVNKLVVDAEKAQRAALWDKAMNRGRSLLRVVELDTAVLDCTASDIQPLTEYELFITAYGGADRSQAAVQAPSPDDLVDRPVQTDEIKLIDRTLTMPDDFGLFVRSRAAARRAAAIDKVGTGGDDDPLRGGSGGDALRFEAFDVDHDALSRFLSRTYPIFHTILDESLSNSLALMGAKKTKKLEFSVAYTTLSLEAIVGGRALVHTAFSSLQSQYLLTVYAAVNERGTAGTSKPESKEDSDIPFLDGIIAIWNVNNPLWPDRILAAPTGIKTAAFSPTRPYIVYGGGNEGQMMVWDLREPDHMHTTGMRSSFGVRKHAHKKKKESSKDKKEEADEKGIYVIRYPTHTTQWDSDVQHPFPIHTLVVEGSNASYVKSNTGDDANAVDDEDEGESIATLDQGGVLSFWVLQDLPGGEHQIAERDYGLAPFARVKLLRSSFMEVRNPDRVTGRIGGETSLADMDGSVTGAQRSVETLAPDYLRQVGTSAFAFVPRDSSRYLIGTDTGFIVHANRFNALVQPPLYYSAKPNECLNLREQAIQLALPRDLKYGTTCMCVAFCPTNPDFFVAGFSDGSVSLYRDGLLQPLFTFGAFTNRPITRIEWSHSWKGVFFALSDEGTFYTFDLMNDDIDKRKDVLLSDELVKRDKGTEDGVTYPASFDVSWDRKGDSRVAVAYQNGSVAVHVLKDTLFSDQQRNQDFFETIDGAV